MKAAVLHEVNQPLQIEEVDIADPGPREVLVRTRASGVCHSDLHFVEGLYTAPMPILLGHEAAGTVEAVGSQVHYVSPGDRVICCLSVFCGVCERCTTGRTVLCTRNGLIRGPDETPRLSQGGEPVTQFANLGAYADMMLVHENSLVKIEQDIGFEQMALIGCGATTGLGAALNTAKVEPGSTVAVIGAGGVGLNAIQGAALMNASRVIVVDIHDHKLEFAYKFGATDVINAKDRDAVDVIHEMTGDGVDFAFDTFGHKLTTEQAYKATRKGGTTVIVGLAPDGMNAEIPLVELVRNQKTLVGSYYGSASPHETFRKLLSFYKQGRIDVGGMVTRRYKLDEINMAYEALERAEDGRGVIIFD